jgi:ATPase family associated with various cellular activities (AAA)
VARSREAPPQQPAAPAGWWSLADALLDRVLLRHRAAAGAADVDLAALDAAVERSRAAFHAGLSEPTPFAALAHNAGLAADDAEVLAVAAAIEAEPARQRIVAALQDDATVTRLSLHLLGLLFPAEHAGVRAVGPESPLRAAALVEVIDDGPWAAHTVAVHPTVMWALAGDSSADDALPLGADLIEVDDPEGDPFVAVTGEDQVRRREEALWRTAGARFLVTPTPDDEHGWAAVVREATIVGAGAIIELGDSLPPAGRRWIERARHLSWAVTSRRELPIDQMPDRPWSDYHAPATEPSDEEWEAFLGDTPRSHRLSPAQLRLVGRIHREGADLDRSVRRLAGGLIDTLARRIRPTRGWDDIVLSPDRSMLLHEVVSRYRHADRVYNEWEFSAAPSRGQVALFSGPSGTGKTLAAEIIAGELGLDLFKLDLSAVVSKYIGETEKNLDQVFDAARAGNVVLFFDEADALFGKRSEVNDARDRYANIEVSYLLQRLESYDGLVTLATNYERNIDDAFLRRIHVRVEFTLPDEAERKAIWEHNLPGRAPVGADADITFLARRFELSGGSIRNAALQAAFLAAAGDGVIDMACLVRGVVREYQKLGRLLRASDFEPYDDLLPR